MEIRDARKILVINGPNLNLTGLRERSIYGDRTLENINAGLSEFAATVGVTLEFFQTNHEGEIIDKLHEARGSFRGVVLNPGAFTHYSYAIRDAISASELEVIEVHISNIHSREDFRAKSVIAPVCRGQICGLGEIGYRLAVEALI